MNVCRLCIGCVLARSSERAAQLNQHPSSRSDPASIAVPGKSDEAVKEGVWAHVSTIDTVETVHLTAGSLNIVSVTVIQQLNQPGWLTVPLLQPHHSDVIHRVHSSVDANMWCGTLLD